ncbi:MAG: hypothetical protein HY904_03605 [Deltaproteobacteria bacterium]|nr:hypothetical protein [Deltaproteobacteria bacterium]
MMTGRTLHMDWASLESAFENHSPDARSYVDRASGEVVTVLGDDTTDALAKRVAEGPENFARVEPIPSREQYRMMERFIATVVHAELKTRLQDSIVGKGAFRRFKDVVTQYADERKRWFTFRDVLAHQYILDWMKQHRLEPDEPPPWTLDLPMEPAPITAGAEPPAPEPEEARPETGDLKRYLQAWARAHGEEYSYLFGPAAFDRLADDMSGEFTFFRRR